MIREATVNDSTRIAEIDVTSSRYAYQNIVSEECLYKDLSVENRIPVHRRWITEKRFGVYVYEDPDTGIIKGMMGIGMSEDDDKRGAFELHYLYVDPDYLRMGVGSECCGSLNRRARRKAAGNLSSGFWKKTKREGAYMKRTTTVPMERKRCLNDGISGKSDM